MTIMQEMNKRKASIQKAIIKFLAYLVVGF